MSTVIQWALILTKHHWNTFPSDKRCITATFGISLNNNFLPIQLIYAGKTEQSFPRSKLLDEFSLSVSPTHYSNSLEPIKLIHEIMARHIENERQNLNLPPTHKALLIMGIFTGQMTDDVHAVLNKNHMCFKCAYQYDSSLPTPWLDS